MLKHILYIGIFTGEYLSSISSRTQVLSWRCFILISVVTAIKLCVLANHMQQDFLKNQLKNICFSRFPGSA